uniref:Homeobox domain-containing protein n=1 Tax=Ciona savignyi TaxID=51511 RepID=H2ZH45_CIOSA
MQNFHPFLNDGSYTPPKRFRTQMSSLQVRALKSCFRSYKTPSLTECEILGSEVGLPKRVIQVWFQNARAKEKKYKLQNPEKLDKYPEESPPQECPTCFPIVRFSTEHDARSHTFSHNHLQQLLKGSDFGTSLDPSRGYSSSPSSSHGSFDNSYMTDQQPCEQQQSEAFGQTTTVSSTTNCTFSQTMGRPPNCEGVNTIDSECGVNEDLSSSPNKEESDQPHEYSNALMSNPALLHQYQQAVQKMMTGNTEVMNETDAQNLHQARLQAFQQSLYKMLNIPHTSAAGGQ